jgi:hypothetical protein
MIYAQALTERPDDPYTLLVANLDNLAEPHGRHYDRKGVSNLIGYLRRRGFIDDAPDQPGPEAS